MEWNQGIVVERPLRVGSEETISSTIKRIAGLIRQGGWMEPSENPAAAHLGSKI